jgi:uncharacterized protein
VQITKVNASTGNWQPLDSELTLLEGDPDFQIQVARDTSASGDLLLVGFAVAQPSSFRYTFEGDESVHILEGEVTIALDEGGSVDLGPGDAASFPKGAQSTWTITAPLKEFFVLSA